MRERMEGKKIESVGRGRYSESFAVKRSREMKQ